VSGCTDSKVLSKDGVRIWDGNSSREFLDNLGFAHREEGDLGPVYGFQWRHFGAQYENAHTDYKGKGIDQLARIVNEIKTNPDSRRIIMTAWNPMDIDKMALPPCHILAQFTVSGNGLSCLLYQRSADIGLGVPFNIASYALLTRMIAHVCGLAAHELVYCLGDSHIYLSHIDALKQQISRTPRTFPLLKIKRKVNDIDDFQFSDFLIENYAPYSGIKMDMAV